MDYNFFLFVKLLDEISPSKIEYDLQFEIVSDMYNKFLAWDTMDGDLYEAIIKFINNEAK